MHSCIAFLALVFATLLSGSQPVSARNDVSVPPAWKVYGMEWSRLRWDPTAYYQRFHEMPLPVPGLGLNYGESAAEPSHEARLRMLTYPAVRQVLMSDDLSPDEMHGLYRKEVQKWNRLHRRCKPTAELEAHWQDIRAAMRPILKQMQVDIARARAKAMRTNPMVIDTSQWDQNHGLYEDEE